MSAPGTGTGRYIGQRVRRKEDPRLLTGRGQFVDDIALPGMLHVAFARSSIARGNILSIKTDVAREVPGVHAVYTQQDLARFKVDMMNFFFISPEVEITPLANGRVAYVGEPVALVIADSRHIAEDGASLVEIEYAEEEPVVTIADARRGPPVHPAPKATSLRKWATKRSTRISTRCSSARRTSSPTRSFTSASRSRRWRRAGSSPSATAPRS